LEHVNRTDWPRGKPGPDAETDPAEPGEAGSPSGFKDAGTVNPNMAGFELKR